METRPPLNAPKSASRLRLVKIGLLKSSGGPGCLVNLKKAPAGSYRKQLGNPDALLSFNVS